VITDITDIHYRETHCLRLCTFEGISLNDQLATC